MPGHFELDLRAMTIFGADTTRIDRFLDVLRGGLKVQQALKSVELPDAVRQFVSHTFSEIEGGHICRIASAFTFGREDLLPDVFQKIVNELSEKSDGRLDAFKYYLLRHVLLDGDEHGPMAARLISSLCGSDTSQWQAKLEDAVVAATPISTGVVETESRQQRSKPVTRETQRRPRDRQRRFWPWVNEKAQPKCSLRLDSLED